MVTIASVPDALCYPPAGLDYMDPTTATIELEIIDMFNEVLTFEGPTTVSRSDPYDPGDGRIKIDTEIVSMELTKTSVNIGEIMIIESPSKESSGAVQQLSSGEDFPADSFFDVYVEIQTPFGTLHNDDPVFMYATIHSIPPWGSTYESLPEPIPVKDEENNIVGFIKHVSHKIPPPSVGGIEVAVDMAGLLAPYIGLASTIATVAAAIYVKHVKHRKKQ